MKTLSKTLAIALEAVGICAIVAGILFEYLTGAPLGYIVITSGAATVAVGTFIFAKLLMK